MQASVRRLLRGSRKQYRGQSKATLCKAKLKQYWVWTLLQTSSLDMRVMWKSNAWRYIGLVQHSPTRACVRSSVTNNVLHKVVYGYRYTCTLQRDMQL